MLPTSFSEWIRPLITGPTAALFLGLGACAPAVHTPPAEPEPQLYDWFDDHGPGSVSLIIHLGEQLVTVTRDGNPIGWSYVATGKEGHATRPGRYTITEKIEDKYSNLYGWTEDEFGETVNPDAKASSRVPKGEIYVPAPMPYWMRLTSYGIGMHAGVIPQPGEPASHGCIRLPHGFAPLLFEAVAVGTPVIIKK